MRPHAEWGVQPTLSDDVVVLTAFTDDDAPTMVEWDHDPEIARWFDFPALPSKTEHLARAREAIRTWQADYRAGARIAWAVRDLASDALVGSVELRAREDGGMDASYATHPAYRGRGLATRALSLVSRWALELGCTRVVVEVDSRNPASEAVARAAGFERAGSRVGGMRYADGDRGDAVILELRDRRSHRRTIR